MSEFTFLFRGSDPTAQSPEEMQKSMQKWLAWFKELGEKGHIKYPGHPLERTGKVVRGKQKSVHDGPYAEAKDIVNGFTLIERRTFLTRSNSPRVVRSWRWEVAWKCARSASWICDGAERSSVPA